MQHALRKTQHVQSYSDIDGQKRHVSVGWLTTHYHHSLSMSSDLVLFIPRAPTQDRQDILCLCAATHAYLLPVKSYLARV